MKGLGGSQAGSHHYERATLHSYAHERQASRLPKIWTSPNVPGTGLGTYGLEGLGVRAVCLVCAARVLVGVCEVVAGGQGVGVGLAQDPLAVGEGALVQRDGLLQPPGVAVGGGEAVTGAQGAGVGLTQDPLAVSEGALQQRDGLLQPPGVPVGASEAVTGGQGVGVGLAQDPLAVSEGALQQRDGLLQPPGVPVGGSEAVAVGQGVGWASPRTRAESVRVRSNSGMASSSRPAAR